MKYIVIVMYIYIVHINLHSKQTGPWPEAGIYREQGHLQIRSGTAMFSRSATTVRVVGYYKFSQQHPENIRKWPQWHLNSFTWILNDSEHHERRFNSYCGVILLLDGCSFLALWAGISGRIFFEGCPDIWALILQWSDVLGCLQKWNEIATRAFSIDQCDLKKGHVWSNLHWMAACIGCLASVVLLDGLHHNLWRLDNTTACAAHRVLLCDGCKNSWLVFCPHWRFPALFKRVLGSCWQYASWDPIGHATRSNSHVRWS